MQTAMQKELAAISQKMMNSNNTIPSGGWSNSEGQVAEVRFTGDQSIQKRQSRSMEEALQNEISTKIADMEQRMREDFERLQTKLHADMDSKLELKLESTLAPIREKLESAEKLMLKVTEGMQTTETQFAKQDLQLNGMYNEMKQQHSTVQQQHSGLYNEMKQQYQQQEQLQLHDTHKHRHTRYSRFGLCLLHRLMLVTAMSTSM